MILKLPEAFFSFPQRTIGEYKAYLDYCYGPKQTDQQLLPSDWVDLLGRVDYLPGWTIEVTIRTLAMTPSIQLDAEAPGGLGYRHVVSAHAAPDEQCAGYIIERMLTQLQLYVHKAAFTIRPA